METTLHPMEVAKKAFSSTGGSGGSAAVDVSYNNTESGLPASNVQVAIDSLSTALTSVDEQLQTSDDTVFYFDKQGDMLGFNTDENRDPDTFIPFTEKIKSYNKTGLSLAESIDAYIDEKGLFEGGSIKVLIGCDSGWYNTTIDRADNETHYSGIAISVLGDNRFTLHGNITAGGASTVTSPFSQGANVAVGTIDISVSNNYNIQLGFKPKYIGMVFYSDINMVNFKRIFIYHEDLSTTKFANSASGGPQLQDFANSGNINVVSINTDGFTIRSTGLDSKSMRYFAIG